MAHVAKFTRGTCGLLARHYERYKNRDKERGEEYVKYKNQDIDPERTYLNYNLAPMREQMPYLKKRLEEVQCLKRDDVNVMCDWVVTAPKELPAEYQREFFEVCYKHLEEKYGEKNVLSAYVHMDENQPHMHFAFIPVVYDPKKDREKVSAKEALNRTQLKHFHPELQKVIDNWIDEKEYEFECNVLNGATEGGNKTVEELKIETLRDIRKEEEYLLEEANKETNKAWGEVQSLQYQIEELEEKAAKYDDLKDEIKDLETKRDNLQNEVAALSDQKDKVNKQIEDLNRNLGNVNELKEKAQSDLESKEKKLKDTEKAIDARETYLGVLNDPAIDKIKGKARENVISKIQGKDEVILDKADYMDLIRTTRLVSGLKKKMEKMAAAYNEKMDQAERAITGAKIKIRDMLDKARSEAREIIDEARGKGVKMRLEDAKNEIDLERYRNLEERFPDTFKKMRNDMQQEKSISRTIPNHDYYDRSF